MISPASATGKRAEYLLDDSARFDLALRIRQREGVSLGEAFSFLSGLYFRGKNSYAQMFGRPARATAGHYVITSDRGLLESDERVHVQTIREFSHVTIDVDEPRYTAPLTERAKRLVRKLPSSVPVILLGSIASSKYLSVLLPIIGERLLVLTDFIGLGDMSRGALLLRAVREGRELECSKAANSGHV